MKDVVPEGTPEFDVWIHLSGGLDQAREELDALEPEQKLLLEVMAEYIFQARTQLSVSGDARGLVEQLIPVLDNPWVKQALDVRLAEDLIDRGVGGFNRYRGLVAVLRKSSPGAAATLYVREASLAYVYGLYPSCIAFCGASLEAILRDWLDSRDQAMHQKATAGALLNRVAEELGQDRLVVNARELVSLRNDAMHGRLHQQSELEEKALHAIGLLTDVLARIETDAEFPPIERHD